MIVDKMENTIEAARKVIEICNVFSSKDITTYCLSDDGQQVSGHWTGTKDQMETQLGRPLTDWEVTALSISRRNGFGPTPELPNDDVCEDIIGYLWAGAHAQEEYVEWEALSIGLQNYVEGLEQELKWLEEEQDYWEVMHAALKRENEMREKFSLIGKDWPEGLYVDYYGDFVLPVWVGEEEFGYYDPKPYPMKFTGVDYRRASAMGISL